MSTDPAPFAPGAVVPGPAVPGSGDEEAVDRTAADRVGVFVSFEGGDGVGKSTQVALLGHHLASLGREVVVTREPGGTPLGVELRRAVLHGEDLEPRTEALLYAADRAHHVASLVRPALARGAVVLTDRYLDSSVAYQGTGRGLGADEVERLSLWAVQGLLPQVTVLLDLDPVLGLARLTGDPDRLESAGDEFHRRTREAFLARAAADPTRWLVVDASQPAEDVAAQVRTRLAPLLEAPGSALTASRGGSSGASRGGAA